MSPLLFGIQDLFDNSDSSPSGKMFLMDVPLDSYRLNDAASILTPALLIYPEIVEANIRATLRMLDDDAERWRPHIKTVKSAAVLSLLFKYGVVNLKCATTLELLLACETGAADILLSFSVVGANAARTLEIAEQFPRTRVSVLIENEAQAHLWRGTNVGIFVDVNGGMNRTGISPDRSAEIVALATLLVPQFRGLHYYDGNMSSYAGAELEKQAHEGYSRLLGLVADLRAADVHVEEVITSGTPAAPAAMSFAGFRDASFIHRVSPGTVVFNDLNSLKQLPGYGYAPAALVLTSVISQPAPGFITCDAGHKAVSADSGVPTCAVIGHSELTPLKPSEEHLPMQVAPGAACPAIGEMLYLLPKHVCPTVNNFDEALLVIDGSIQSVSPIDARGHERPLLNVEAQFADASY